MNFLKMSVADLIEFGKQKSHDYVNALPFPNIYFDNFFNPEVLDTVVSEFPEIGKELNDIQFNTPNENKLATKGEYRFGETTRQLVHFLNSQPFLEFLQNISGITETLIPDPFFEGGGFHEIKPGGFLKMHVDFHKHKHTGLDRRLNVLVYLNKDWEESYGGCFELWERDMSKGIVKILPLFNRMAIFSTTGYSWHGHPDALNCPPNRSRRSLALYYYSNGRPAEEVEGADSSKTITSFTTRKGQDSNKMILFNTYKKALRNWVPPIILKTAKKITGKKD